MKKFFILIIIAVLAFAANAQDFSAVCETGQTLYYKISDKTNHHVDLVYPGSSFLYGNIRSKYPWDGYTKPAGKVVLPSYVEYNGEKYKVVSIDMSAFKGCNDMTSLTISNTITDIHSNVLDGCRNLAELRVIPGNPVYDSRDNCNAIINTKEKELVFGCKNTVIPKTVTSLGWSAFRGSGLTSIIIPNSVNYISQDAFYDCWISSLTIPSSVKRIGDIPFESEMVTASLTTTPLMLEVDKYYFEEYYDQDDIGHTACVVPCGMKKIYEKSPWGKYFTFHENCDTYSINFENEGDGVVEISANQAKFGETVSVYYIPKSYSEEYYLLVSSQGSYRANIPMRSGTFIMPPYDVTVKVIKR